MPSTPKQKMTYAQALEKYRYESETGKLFLRKHARCASISEREIPGLDAGGYVQVNAGRFGQIKGHRLAWLLHYGEWPEDHIDHINGVRNDNRIENLRVVTNAVNCQNKREPKNASGLMGVHFYKGAYRAKVQINRKQVHLGRFETAEEAHAAYLKAKRELHVGCTI